MNIFGTITAGRSVNISDGPQIIINDEPWPTERQAERDGAQDINIDLSQWPGEPTEEMDADRRDVRRLLGL